MTKGMVFLYMTGVKVAVREGCGMKSLSLMLELATLTPIVAVATIPASRLRSHKRFSYVLYRD